MPANTTYNIRIDKKIRDEADALYKSMGLTLSSAINLFLTQSVIQGRLPINDIVAHTYKPKPETIALINRIESGEEKLVRFNSVEELLSDLNSEGDDDE
jgi:DNA-damage-inducible protein J